MACTSASRLASLAAPSRIGFLEADGCRLVLPRDALATILVAPFQKSPDDQHALLSGRRLVPSRHIARRSIVVPLLELMGRTNAIRATQDAAPSSNDVKGIVHPLFGVIAPRLETKAE